MTATTQSAGALLATAPGMVTRRRRSGDMAHDSANPLNVPFGYCHCGCGQTAAPGRFYIKGHNRRGTGSPVPDFPDRLCECGCGRPTRRAQKTDLSSGRVKGMPMRYLRGHQGRKRTPEYLVEDRGFTSPCWTWQRGKMTSGYGVTRRPESGKRALLAHRVYYEAAHGPIPDGLHIDHLCRNRDCVNPSHLEAVLPAINHRRGEMVRLTQDDVDNIRASYPRETKESLARRYSVTETHIRYIVQFRTWKEIA